MTYVPTAYTRRVQEYHWIFINTPSGLPVRLTMNYPSQSAAEDAIAILGFKLVSVPRGDLHVVTPVTPHL
jgi:hypothetical protein